MKHLTALALLLLLLLGCDQTNPTTPDPTTDVANIPTAAPTRSPDDGIVDTAVVTAADARFDLNIWLTEQVNIDDDSTEATLLAFQLSEFDTTHPDVNLNITHKLIAGQGGSLSYLRSGAGVAPSILPDVIVLPTSQLAIAMQEGLVYPLDALLDVEGLYPAAETLGTVNGSLYGMPFMLTDLYHLAYNNTQVETVPQRWDALVAQEDSRLVFAAAGTEGAAFALQAYAGVDDSFANGNTTAFDTIQLAAAMDLVRNGIDSGLIVPQSATLTSSAETWNLFRRGDANLALVRAQDFLEEQTEGTSINYAQVPGIRGDMSPIVSGWVWAITTQDAARQAISAELLQWLNNAQNLGSWTAAAGVLPARPVAFAQWETSPYITFLQTNLQNAHALPAQIDSVSTNALSNAVVSIMNQPISAEDAANQVIEALQP